MILLDELIIAELDSIIITDIKNKKKIKKIRRNRKSNLMARK
jgi:hypothetical protein